MLEKPKTLGEILAWLDDVDNGIRVATPEDQAHVGALLAAKIDNTKGVIDELEFQEARLRKAAKELSEGARQVASRVERIKSYMAHHMVNCQYQQLPGELWKARLTSGESVEPIMFPDPALLEGAADYIRTKYEWDKKALKAGIEADDPVAKSIARLVPSNSVTIGVNKGKLSE